MCWLRAQWTNYLPEQTGPGQELPTDYQGKGHQLNVRETSQLSERKRPNHFSEKNEPTDRTSEVNNYIVRLYRVVIVIANSVSRKDYSHVITSLIIGLGVIHSNMVTSALRNNQMVFH